MVGRKQKVHTIPWLNKCFSIIGKYYRKNNIMPKVHLLGVASHKILYRYPCFSCDSTSFMQVNRFGSSNYLNKINLPKSGKISALKNNYNQDDEQKLLNKIMKKEIQLIQKQEKEITEFWKKKGIVYE